MPNSSDCKIEATASESLLRTSLRLDALVATLSLVLGLSLVLVAALLLDVPAFHVLKLTGKALDLVLVLVNLSLVHVELRGHCLHLAGLLLEVLLVDGELFSHFGARLSRQQVFQLNVQLFLLLDNYVLFNNFLSLLDKTFLECLDLLEHFPGVGVSALKFAPSVVVERVFKFLTESFD